MQLSPKQGSPKHTLTHSLGIDHLGSVWQKIMDGVCHFVAYGRFPRVVHGEVVHPPQVSADGHRLT